MTDAKKNKKSKTDKAALSARHRYTLACFTIVLMLVFGLSGGIVFMLVNTTVVHADQWRDKHVTRLKDSLELAPMRGEIYATDGSILATNLTYYDLSIDFRTPRFMVYEYDSLVSVLADTLAHYYPEYGRNSREWEKYLRRPIDEKARKDRSRGYRLLRNLPTSEVDRVKKFPFFNLARSSDSTGLVVTPVICRVYPYGDMAKLSVGRVGFIDGGSAKHGISGLEKALDTLLYGTPGIRRKVMLTKNEGYITETPAIKGCDVFSTIDVTMQDILEQELSSVVLNGKADWGTAILMEVATGDIKAISNVEPDTVNGGVIEAYNRAVLGYEPGSVVKVMSMAVALAEGYAKPLNREYPIGHYYSYLGRGISDTHSPASLPVSRFIEYSSNIGMVKLTMPHFAEHPNEFRAALRKLGFFDRFNTGIAREVPPYYPTLKENREGQLNLSRMVFGYSTQIPPLYTCAFYNAIANDGRFVRPRIARALRLPDGRDSIIDVSYVRDRILSHEDNEALKQMIHEVVWGQGGTAKSLKDKTVEIAGKTGTSRVARERPKDKNGKPRMDVPFVPGYIDNMYRYTFCGFFPYENPKYTCIVVVQNAKGEYRGPALSSGRVLKNVALKLYARGLLDNSSDYAEAGSRDDHTPTLYPSHNAARTAALRSAYDIKPHEIMPPQLPASSSVVPNVRGLGVREAVVLLEKAGLNVDFNGVGYVESQSLAAGTPVTPGQHISLTLKQF